MTQGRVIYHYLSLLVWPGADRLQLDYEFTVSRGLLDPPTTLAAASVLAAITVAAILGWNRARWPAFGWLFFLLALSVESSIILLELVFEHRLYLPGTMLIAGVLAPLFTLPVSDRARRWSVPVLFLVAGALAVQTAERNRQWQDIGTFWSGDLERGASVYRSALNSGIAYLRAGRPERALAMFDRIRSAGAATTPAERAKVEQLIGEARFRRGEHEAALTAFRRALADRPGWTRSAYFAGMALTRLGRLDDARTMLAQMRDHRPDSVFTISLAAELVYLEGSPADAADFVESRLEQVGRVSAVDRSFLYLHLGNMYLDAGDRKVAAALYRAALEADRENWAAAASLERIEAIAEGEQDPEPER